MKLVTIDDGRQGSAGALMPSGWIVDFAAWGGVKRDPQTASAADLPRSVRGLLEAEPAIWPRLAAIIEQAQGLTGTQLTVAQGAGAILPPDTPLLAPVPDPQLILAAGLAYRSHLEEMAGTPAPAQPTGFLKAPSSISGPAATVRIPPHASNHVDYEGEFACIFGAACHNVSADEALRYVAGYTAANDLSARDWVKAAWQAQSPWEARSTWEVNLMGKQFPGFTAIGPVLTTIDEMPDLSTTRLITTVNGRIMQQALLDEMLFSVAETIAYFSRWYSFRPGDILLTGTPAGVGVGRNPPVFLHPGDRVDVSIDGIGTLTTYLE